MGFLKTIKNKSYYKRYQVQYRRRREGKTDYYARKRLTAQDKNKYNSPKYRLVVRFTNKDVITQIASAHLKGDKIIACAYSHELPRFGLKVGLTNYAATYATGLLLARRLLKGLKLDSQFKGTEKITGEFANVGNSAEGRRPFKALLDVGLARTTTGSRVFAALKGAVDGGIFVPHSERRFAGYDADEKKFKPDVLRKYIFAGHVGEYMKKLKTANAEDYNARFSQYIKNGLDGDKLKGAIEKTHAAIRANPDMVKKDNSKAAANKKMKHPAKRTLKQRKQAIRAKFEAHAAGK
jgi:large subunit ribosomal protein L5e